MEDYGYKPEPIKSDISYREDFGYKFDLRQALNTVYHMDTEKQNKYEASRDRLLSSPLLTDDLLKKTMINKFVNHILISSNDPFDSFCEVVSHFKGIEKDNFIQMDIDERAKRTSGAV